MSPAAAVSLPRQRDQFQCPPEGKINIWLPYFNIRMFYSTVIQGRQCL
jgi:hypothetical protein